MHIQDHHSLIKRQILKINFGGHESNPDVSIKGNSNRAIIGDGADPQLQLTLLRKAGEQAGRILEGGTEVALAPVKWLTNMQENWYACLAKISADPLWKLSLCGLYHKTVITE